MYEPDGMGVLTVAKKKPAPKKAPSGPESWSRKPLIANFRGSEEFKAWLQGLATADRQTVAGVIERALVHYAKSIDYEPAPER